jgi:hypothetical protein
MHTSITQILNYAAAPALVDWKVNAILRESFNQPPDTHESYQEFNERIRADHIKRGDTARLRGEAIHNEIELSLKEFIDFRYPPTGEYSEALFRILDQMNQTPIAVEDKLSFMGAGNTTVHGRADLITEDQYKKLWFWDYKVSLFDIEKAEHKKPYTNQAMQLGGYRVGMKIEKPHRALGGLVNCYIHSELPFIRPYSYSDELIKISEETFIQNMIARAGSFDLRKAIR